MARTDDKFNVYTGCNQLWSNYGVCNQFDTTSMGYGNVALTPGRLSAQIGRRCDAAITHDRLRHQSEEVVVNKWWYHDDLVDGDRVQCEERSGVPPGRGQGNGERLSFNKHGEGAAVDDGGCSGDLIQQFTVDHRVRVFVQVLIECVIVRVVNDGIRAQQRPCKILKFMHTARSSNTPEAMNALFLPACSSIFRPRIKILKLKKREAVPSVSILL